MSTTIDNKVVEMRFDNRNFENNVQTSMSTLDKLKQSLRMKGATDGLEEVDSAVKKISFAGLTNAVDTVGLKFNAMYTIADQALRNITNSAMAAGKRIINALTIDPVKTGLQEYETQINAVQTILANTESKGSTLGDVTKALDELNEYADKTIYNFTEMTRNIGTFTAAGVDLDTSVTAIQGIANLAAVSGSTSQQASTAMYQLSQALSSGTVKLMDWNSVVNAGMGGQVFQDALKETARVHGISIDSMIEKNGSFRETLQEGWLSSEILLETLEKFTMTTEGLTDAEIAANKEKLKSKGYTDEQIDAIFKLGATATDAATKVKTATQLWDTLKETAQSGWTQTWELIFGDFEEAKDLFSGLYNTFAPMIEATAKVRNELLQGWSDEGGRKMLVDSIYNIIDGLTSIVKPIKEAFRDIFPPVTVQHLLSFTEGIKNLTEKLKISEGTSDKLKRTFKGLFAILDIGKQLFGAVFRVISPLFGGVGDLSGGILSLTAKIGDWLVKLDETIKSSKLFIKISDGIASSIKKIIGVVKEKLLTPGWELFHSFLESLHDRLASVREMLTNVKESVTSSFDSMGSSLARNGFFKLMQSLWKGITTIATGVGKAISEMAKGLMNVFSGDGFGGFVDNLNGLITGGVGIGIIKFLKSVTDTVKSFDFGEISENIVNVLDGVRGCFEAYQTKLKADALMKIAGAIAILAISLVVISAIDSDKLLGAVAAIGTLFAMLAGTIKVLGSTMAGSSGIKGLVKDLANMKQLAGIMISISIAILILASAVKKLGDLDFDDLIKGLVGVAALMGIVIVAMKTLSNGSKNVIKGATQMVILAAAVKILASACSDLAYLSWGELVRGLVGVGVLLAELSLFLNTAKFSSKSITTATGIVILAAAIKVLASACSDFGRMSWGEIGKGLTAIGALLAEIAIFTNLTGNAKHVLSTGVALIAIAAAVKIFASAAEDIAQLSWGELTKGLVALAGSLAAITIALRLMPKNMLTMGVGLIAVSTAILILSKSLTTLGGMSWESIAKGMVALGGAMLILAIGLNAMNGTLAGTASLLIAVAALAILVPVLSILGAMSWSAIAKGLISIAGAFAIIGLAGALLSPVIPSILALAGALALIGVAVLAFGAGVAALGVGLTTLGAGITALVASIGAILTGIVGIITAVIVGILKGIGEGIVALCQVIIDGIPAIAEAVKVIILALCDVLVECVPVLADTILVLVAALLKSLVEYTPTIVEALFDFLIGILESIAKKLPELIKAGVNVIKAFFEGVLGALSSEMGLSSIIDALGAVSLMVGLMAALSMVSSLVPSAMLGVLGMGVVVTELALVLAAIGALAQISGLTWLIEEGGEFLQTVGNAIGGFIGGIVGGITEGMSSALPDIGTNLSDFMANVQPFIEGAKTIDSSVIDGVKNLVGVFLALTGANIFDKLTSWLTGGSSLSDFGKELAEFGPYMKQYADSIGDIDASAIQASASAARALAEMASVIPNSGGVASWFAGENSIAQFGDELISLGDGLKGFSDSIVGVNPESIITASNAAKALAEMTSTIPNSGGMVAWFTGENSIAKFGDELISLGMGLNGFATATAGINPELIINTANAAKALVDMTNYIPNEGGVAAWFAGDNSISKFSEDIVDLGVGLMGFATTTTGINPEGITATANAAKALAEMTTYIPNEGGIAAWFSGENSISKFSSDLLTLGQGLKGFATVTFGINTESVTAAANAAKSLAEMTTYIPNEGGVVAWFTGENSIANFAANLPALGLGLKGFSDSIDGINPDNVSSAANAAKALAEMANVIPKEGGIKAWFTGETSIATFADKLPTLGKGLTGFSSSVEGIKPETTTAAAEAAKSLGEMTSVIPKNTDRIGEFGNNLIEFGKDLKSYFSNTSGITAESITSSTNAIDAVKKTTELNSDNIKSAAKALDDITESVKNLSKIPKDSTSKFKRAMVELGEVSADELLKALNELEEDTKKAGENAMKSFAKGIKDSISKVETACEKVVDACVEALSGSDKAFAGAGKDVAVGFANGISANAYKAEAKARAMAKAAVRAAEDELDINSPSRRSYETGTYFGLGFVNALDSFADASYKSGAGMAESARSGLSRAISKIKDIISGDVDVQPTIRPVLDLSNVRSEARNISSLLGAGASVGIMANVGAISTMMNRRNQNGGNSDIVSAIDRLQKGLSDTKPGDTYNINGVTYDDGSNINDAVRTIIRAARVERRK